MTTQHRPYRGKRIDNNEWVEGWYVFDQDTSEHRIYFNVTYNYVTSLIYKEVHPDTVGQATGRKCIKSKRPIYQGDNIKALMGHSGDFLPIAGTVEYSDKFSAFGIVNEAGFTSFVHIAHSTIEITGSIHDKIEGDGK